MADKLFNRNFVLLWQGQLVSQLGSQAFAIAMMYWLMETTGSASLMGVLMMVSMLPMVILSPIGGTVADWFPRRTIIIVSDALSGVGVLSLAILMLLRPESHEFLIAWLFAIAVIGGVIRAFFMPAIAAAIPDLVPEERVPAANSLNQLSVQVSTFIGQGLGGVFYRIFGAPLLMLFDGLTFLFSAVSESFIQIPQRTHRQHTAAREAMTQFARDTWEGFAYVVKQRGMRNVLLAFSVLNFMVMPVFVLLPFYVELFLGSDVVWYGLLLAAISSGSVVGNVAAGAMPISASLRGTISAALLLAASVLLGSLAVVDQRYLAFAVLFLTGTCTGWININVITIFQTVPAEEMRGRVMSLVMTMSMAVTPLGMGLGGLLGDLTGKNIPLIYGVCGGAAAVTALLAAMNRSYREFLRGEAGA